MTTPVRVLIADDHPAIRRVVSRFLELAPGIEVVGQAASGDEALRRCRHLAPDVLLLDLSMAGPPPAEVARQVRRDNPGTRVLVLTAYEAPARARPLRAAGIAGYVLKDEAPDELVPAIRSVARGGEWYSGAGA